MRISTLLGTSLVIAATVAPHAAGQSSTQLALDLSYGLFDGVGVGMAHTSHVAGVAVLGMIVAVGRRSGGTPYGIYSDLCWDRAWDLRWGRGYYGWHGSARYDHLDFYDDCRSRGIAHAYDRWRWRTRRAHLVQYPGRRTVQVSIYVKDPFWKPWGPFWAYDPWGWYWDGYHDGRRDRRWARSGWGSGRLHGGARTVIVPTGRGVIASRPSPLASPRFKEDPRGVVSNGGTRRAVPRAGQVAAPATAAAPKQRIRPSERAGGRAPTPARTRRPTVGAAPSTGRERPTDAVGTRRASPSTPAARTGSERAGSDRGRAARPAAAARPGRPSAPAARGTNTASPSSRARGGGPRPAEARPVQPRPVEPRRAEPRATTQSPGGQRTRSAPTARAEPKARSAPPTRAAPSTRTAPTRRAEPKARAAPDRARPSPERSRERAPAVRRARPR